MTRTLELHRVDDVPPDSKICHFDELGEHAQEHLATLTDAGRSRGPIDRRAVSDFHGCDLVKYTSYYAVSVDEYGPGSD